MGKILNMELFFSPNESEPGMQGEKPECIWIIQENLIKPDFQQAIFVFLEEMFLET